MATISSPTYDPTSTAAALADNYVSASQQTLDARTSRAKATEKGLNDLSSALSAFQTSLASLTGLNKTLFSQAATFSDTSIGSAKTSAGAAAGTYSFVVEQLATASQMTYGGLADGAHGGTLKVKLGTDVSFDVELDAGDADGDSILTVRELAAAINSADGNTSLVSASVVTIGGVAQLVLTAKNTGASSAISLDASAVVDNSDPQAVSTLKTAIETPENVKETIKAQDAIVWLGAKDTGAKMEQASNTFTNIDGVTMTFTKASATPVTLTVGADSAATTANVQAFIEAYNKLKSSVDAMLSPGDPSKGKASGVFAGDSGVRALQSRLVSMLRGGAAGSASLAGFGITATRQGTLTLDSARLTKALAADPGGLDALIGSSASSAPSGIAGQLDTYLKQWSSSTNGQIKLRKEAVSRLQSDLTSRQLQLDRQYDAAYQRYLLQFSQLQALQGQMTSNSSLFDALFSNSDD
jgi:flagellar hook-associated protein 2